MMYLLVAYCILYAIKACCPKSSIQLNYDGASILLINFRLLSDLDCIQQTG